MRETLTQTYAGVRFHEVGDRVRAVFGVPMNRGNTPREAAQAWLGEYGEVFADGRRESGDVRGGARLAGAGAGSAIGEAKANWALTCQSWITGEPLAVPAFRVRPFALGPVALDFGASNWLFLWCMGCLHVCALAARLGVF